jgi:transposase
MIPVPSGVQVWLATGHTDMRKGFDGLAVLVQETLERNPHNGHLFVFRGRRGGLIKVLWHDGQGPVLVREAAGARALYLATFRERSGDDHAGATGISAGRNRLAPAAAYLASDSSGVSHPRDSQARCFVIPFPHGVPC